MSNEISNGTLEGNDHGKNPLGLIFKHFKRMIMRNLSGLQDI